MTNIHLPYGKKQIHLEIPEGVVFDLISTKQHSPHPNPLKAVEDALNTPCDGKKLTDFPIPKQVAIAINDKTRPVPHYEILHPLIKKLNNWGIPNSRIVLIIASGTHPPMPSNEFSVILPDEFLNNEHPIIAHDCDDQNELVYIGNTPAETPVWVNKKFYEADLRIVIGNLEPHHFMGFSGGVKTASVGLCGRETIQHNHAFITHPNARLGCYDENPMRQDVEEIGKLIGIHYAVNAILDKDKKLVHALAGEPLAVMAAGIPLSRAVCQLPVSKQYDIVIASCGGLPKDINLYQAQKAQTNASLITKNGGTIILVAQCPEGVGSQGYWQFMQDVHSTDEVINKFSRSKFEIGPHKAFLFARIASRLHTILVSDLHQDIVEKLLLIPAVDINTAFQQAIASSSAADPAIAVMPHTVATVPHMTQNIS
jgi:nickel-dependent lactate racemase